MTSNPSEFAGAEENSRIRWRNQGGKRRAYADLRSIGGGQPALIPPGEKRATTDPEIAEKLLNQLLAKFEKRKKKKVLAAIDPGPDLADFAIHHLEEQAASDDYDTEWLTDSEAYLALAVDYFTRWQHASTRHPEPLPRRRSLASIDVPDVRAFSEWLKSMRINGDAGGLPHPGVESSAHSATYSTEQSPRASYRSAAIRSPYSSRSSTGRAEKPSGSVLVNWHFFLKVPEPSGAKHKQPENYSHSRARTNSLRRSC
jgi:hypothetical protein